MGGPGSGRRPWRLAVDECRALEVGELCDAGRWQQLPEGEIVWRARGSARPIAELSYVICATEGELTLSYRYRLAGQRSCWSETIILKQQPARRICALCPSCARPVRTLYLPARAERFACRDCWRLVYRPSPQALWHEQLGKAGRPALRVLAALPEVTRRSAPPVYVARPPALLARELAEQLPLAAQELRLWVLRLRAAGLSYRQIATLLESSRSSVARICAAGKKGIDSRALLRESHERANSLPAAPGEGAAPASIDAYLGVLHRRARTLGLYRHPLAEREERIVVAREKSSGFKTG